MAGKTTSIHAERLKFILSWLECEIWDKNGNVLPPRDAVWIVLSRAMEGAMDPKYVYVALKGNRWNVAEEYRSSRFINKIMNDSSSESSEEEDENSTDSQEKAQRPVYPRKTFQVVIPPSQWPSLKPKPQIIKRSDRRSGQREKLALPKQEWTNVLSNLICGQNELPCAFSFQEGRATKNPDLAKYYITVKAECTDCGSVLEGHILHAPTDNEAVVFSYDADDTRADKWHRKKRRCAGSERRRVQGEIGIDPAIVYRRNEASRLMKRPGQLEPPILFNLEVYRKIKQEIKEGALSLSKTLTAIQNIKIMKHDPRRHLGSIHDIGEDPIKIIYITPGQILLNNTLKKQGYYKVELDATGPYCRRLTGIHGLSGQILLYEFVATTPKGTAQLAQLLTEKQDAVTVGGWVEDWQRRGALPPNEVVIDESKALMSVACRKLAECRSTKEYINLCFSHLSGETETIPSCFVRIDFIHFIGKVSKWKMWKTTGNAVLRDHLLRFIGLLVQADTLESFRDILESILILCLAETSGPSTPAETSKHKLQQMIADVEVNNPEQNDENDDDLSEENATPENVKSFLKEIEEAARAKAATKGSDLNPYFNETFAKKLLVEAEFFVMWSAVMVIAFGSPYPVADTGAMEGDFNDLKRRVLKNEAKPLKLDTFIDLHLKSINGQNLIVSADQMQEKGDHSSKKKSKNAHERSSSDSEEHVNSSSESDDDRMKDLRSQENYKNCKKSRARSPLVTMKETEKSTSSKREATEKLQNKSKKSKPGYLEKNPNIQTTSVDKNGRLASKNLLLRNGNLTGFFAISNLGMAAVKNTCSFDAVAQILTSAYIDYQDFRDIVNESKAETLALDLISAFAAKGGCKDIYQKRAELLIPLSSLEGAKEAQRSERTKSRKSTCIYTYTLAKLNEIDDNVPNGNVSALWEVLLSNFPSIVTEYNCPSKHVVSEVLLVPDVERIASRGLKDLQKILNSYLQSKGAGTCPRCSAKCHGLSECQHILILNLEELRLAEKSISSIKLSEIPHSLLVSGKKMVIAGLVVWTGNHFTAFCRRRTGVWEKVDDCNHKTYLKKLSDFVQPHTLIYVPAPS